MTSSDFRTPTCAVTRVIRQASTSIIEARIDAPVQGAARNDDLNFHLTVDHRGGGSWR
jgi:hypothetical protein